LLLESPSYSDDVSSNASVSHLSADSASF